MQSTMAAFCKWLLLLAALLNSGLCQLIIRRPKLDLNSLLFAYQMKNDTYSGFVLVDEQRVKVMAELKKESNQFSSNEDATLPEKCGIVERPFNKMSLFSDQWFPWLMQIYLVSVFGSAAHCGGTLINQRWILTSAGCAINYVPKYTFVTPDGQLNVQMPVDTIVIHRQYRKFHPKKQREISNDIALLRLKYRVSFSDTLSPVCLPSDDSTKEDLNRNNGTCYAMAWGYGNNRYFLTLKHQEAIDIIDCMKRLGTFPVPLHESQHFCTEDAKWRFETYGQRGTPYTCIFEWPVKRSPPDMRARLTGITSWISNRFLNRPTLYTKVAFYRSWIEGVINSVREPSDKILRIPFRSRVKS